MEMENKVGKYGRIGTVADLTKEQKDIYEALIKAGYDKNGFSVKIAVGLWCVDEKLHDCRMIIVDNDLNGRHTVSSFHPDGHPVRSVYEECPIIEEGEKKMTFDNEYVNFTKEEIETIKKTYAIFETIYNQSRNDFKVKRKYTGFEKSPSGCITFPTIEDEYVFFKSEVDDLLETLSFFLSAKTQD